MSRSRPKSSRRKNRRHRRLSPIQKNEVLVLHEMGSSYPEICKRTQLSYGTVAQICRSTSTEPSEIQRIRGEALVRAAKETFAVGLLARAAITEESVTQVRFEERDDDGNLTGLRLVGPTPLQNATTFGILTDKSERLLDRGQNLLEGGKPALDPSHLAALISSLGPRLGKLKMIGVEVEIIDGLQERIVQMQTDQDIVEADFEEVPAND